MSPAPLESPGRSCTSDRFLVRYILYSLNDDGRVLDGPTDTEPSFFHEYKFKLEKLYDGFYTPVARQMAERRRHAATEFYTAMLDEVVSCHELGKSCLDDMLAVPGL